MFGLKSLFQLCNNMATTAAATTKTTISKVFHKSNSSGSSKLRQHNNNNNIGKCCGDGHSSSSSLETNTSNNSNDFSTMTTISYSSLSEITKVDTFGDSGVLTFDDDDDDDEDENDDESNASSIQNQQKNQESSYSSKKIVKHEICCLLAEGSSTCFIKNFSSMIEFYEKISQSFDISIKEIMYCTLNTPKIDMDQVLTGQICLNDIVFIHRKGRRKEIEVRKTEPFLGLTIADNGAGCSYIKKIRPNSTASRVPFIQVGDHIESIMNETMVGRRHYEVASFLKMIPLNHIFTICLVEPLVVSTSNSGYNNSHVVQLRIGSSNNNDREEEQISESPIFKFRNNDYHYTKCSIIINDNDDQLKWQTGLYYINKQLEQFLGINDDELAQELWILATTIGKAKTRRRKLQQKHSKQQVHSDDDECDINQNQMMILIRHNNPMEFIEMIKHSDLSDFKFTEDFLYEIWAIVNDVLNGDLLLQFDTNISPSHHFNRNNFNTDNDIYKKSQQEKKKNEKEDEVIDVKL